MKRKANETLDRQVEMVSNFGKQKLLLYADSFRNLAKTYNDGEKEYDESEDRQNYILKQKLYENREVLADNINNLADILCAVADENITVKQLSFKQEKTLLHFLKNHRIMMDKFCYTEKETGVVQISVDLAYIGKGNFSTTRVAKIFSAILENDVVPVESSPLYLMENFCHFVFVTRPSFTIETGVAKAVKETEKISGDSFSFSEDEKGEISIILSDGMGSGDKAMADSELVISLAERFLEAGYPLKKTMQLINGTLVSGVENKNMSTLDICNINLHTGEAAFAKIGGSVSFIKRGRQIEKIEGGNLPLGIFIETEPEIIHRTLCENDFVILLSDGVLDGLGQVIGEEGICSFLGSLDLHLAKDVANHLLNYVIRVCNGKIKDDMTIIVAKLGKI